MKILATLALFLLISCSQNAEEQQEAAVKIQESNEQVLEQGGEVKEISFNKFLSELKTKETPLYEATKFDDVNEEEFFSEPIVSALKLEKVYPSFYTEGYNSKALSAYKLDFSKGFHSIVVTVLKSYSEIESVLINYDHQGVIIDSKVLSYDEIAEGWSQIEAKIESNTISINNIFWGEEKQEEVKVFEVLETGKIVPVAEKKEKDDLRI